WLQPRSSATRPTTANPSPRPSACPSRGNKGPTGAPIASRTSDLAAGEGEELVPGGCVRRGGLLGVEDARTPEVVGDQLTADLERGVDDLVVVDRLAGRLGDVDGVRHDVHDRE